ncbi:hypothetical protein Tco_0653280 [Tanacetum coccineum]|uniref:Uncharacterized protein n=1 Tax=Tanacetum coccineum TaxID=301880 RepID=A0ABQ4WZX1_9ASTR
MDRILRDGNRRCSSISLLCCCGTPTVNGQIHSNAQVVQAVEAWRHSDFLCHNYVLNCLVDSLYNVYCKTTTAKELWESLERKYKTEDVGTKKFRSDTCDEIGPFNIPPALLLHLPYDARSPTTIMVKGGVEDLGLDPEDLGFGGFGVSSGGCNAHTKLDNQSIERDRLIGIGFVLDFVEFISFTFGDKEMILVIEAVSR